MLLLVCSRPVLAAALCPGPVVALQRLSPTLWRVPGAAGETSEVNRGQISNLLVVHDRQRTWLLGSGPSPVIGRALACRLKARTGWVVTDVIAPWPRPELVLGTTAFPQARVWSHADVAAAMRERCPRCEARLRLRLAARAKDLGSHPIRVATHIFEGDQGEVGPFRWWRLHRAEATAVTVFQVRGQALWTAHGLLWADGPPDLRDAELGPMAAAYVRLAELAHAEGAAARWLPEQGDLLPADAPVRHAHYLHALRADVLAALRKGALETDAPAPETGLNLPASEGLRHGLNWQRAWHLLEDQAFDEPPAP